MLSLRHLPLETALRAPANPNAMATTTPPTDYPTRLSPHIDGIAPQAGDRGQGFEQCRLVKGTARPTDMSTSR